MARVLVWFLAVIVALQLAMGGWPRLRTWTAAKFVGTASTVAVAK